ncbi:uncharacterized protein LOC127526848 [Erpetoichthys calabaricus]|uniref:uncharacterized protein LOC127526848 n=1 Tax=Erpetoichthys calabaricus TaxID=27687 RepID=UPI0022349C5C|nr:uncharacterized protein LOC127526848 [Erpetoichthys calabaricus]
MENYRAAMELSELGRTLCYQNSHQTIWNCDQKRQEQQIDGSPEKITECPETCDIPIVVQLHMATAESLVSGLETLHSFYRKVAKLYSIILEKYLQNNEAITQRPNTKEEAKFGVATRGLSIGMCYSKPEQLDDLVQASIECGRMTHSYPAGFLGSLCTALFVSYAVQGKPISLWGHDMLAVMPLAEEYCRKKIAQFSDYRENWLYFEMKWQYFLQHRKNNQDGHEWSLNSGTCDVKEELKLHRRWCSELSGRDSHLEITLIVYDAFLSSGNDWNKLCQMAMSHEGDTESVVAIAGCLYGLLYGTGNVPTCCLQKLVLRNKMKQLGQELYHVANGKRAHLGEEFTSCYDATSLRHIVKNLSNKRTLDEINNLLNYMAILEKDLAQKESSKSTSLENNRMGKVTMPKKPGPTRFQLLQARFTKLGLKNILEKPTINEPEGKNAISKKICRHALKPLYIQSRNSVQETMEETPMVEKDKSGVFAEVNEYTCSFSQTNPKKLELETPIDLQVQVSHSTILHDAFPNNRVFPIQTTGKGPDPDLTVLQANTTQTVVKVQNEDFEKCEMVSLESDLMHTQQTQQQDPRAESDTLGSPTKEVHISNKKKQQDNRNQMHIAQRITPKLPVQADGYLEPNQINHIYSYSEKYQQSTNCQSLPAHLARTNLFGNVPMQLTDSQERTKPETKISQKPVPGLTLHENLRPSPTVVIVAAANTGHLNDPSLQRTTNEDNSQICQQRVLQVISLTDDRLTTTFSKNPVLKESGAILKVQDTKIKECGVVTKLEPTDKTVSEVHLCKQMGLPSMGLSEHSSKDFPWKYKVYSYAEPATSPQ